MTWFVVDVEADGPCPGLYSMVSFGVVRFDRYLQTTFYGKTRPLDGAKWDPEALAISNITHEEHLAYPDSAEVMQRFSAWLRTNCFDGDRPVFVSDNLAFDWQFVNYYFHRFLGDNPMGYSGRRIGDLYAGFLQRAGASSEWKKLRKTKHTHHPVDDARGNAEALLQIADMGLVIPGV